MSIKGDEVFRVNFVLYNGATEGENYSDMSKADISVQFESGCMNVVFLNKFVNDILVSSIIKISKAKALNIV